MKAINIMENNLTNKAKFLQHYVGCGVIMSCVAKKITIPNRVLNGVILNDKKEETLFLSKDGYSDFFSAAEWVANLKPLSSITDEEIIDIANILMRGREYDYYMYESELNMKVIKTYPKGEDGLGGWFGIYAIAPNNKEFTLEVWDYLRSRGYALPWMGLSVEELQNRGWIKLTSNESNTP